ncbi:hypothetical protein [Listeria aquatica]|nr:hypothetical protein [Listeria aquatica]
MREHNIKQLNSILALLKERRYLEASDEIKTLLLSYGANAFR